MTKLSLYLATLLLGSNFSASVAPRTPPHAAKAQVQLSAEEQRFVDLANSDRRARKLGELSTNALLTQVARSHSREMWQKDYFDHISPTPGLRTPMNRYLHALGYTPRWAYLGENLFYCSMVDTERGHRCLMESPKHRENILNAKFREIGVGVFIAPDGQYYVTQLFLAQVD